MCVFFVFSTVLLGKNTKNKNIACHLIWRKTVRSISEGSCTCVFHHAGIHADWHHHQGDYLREGKKEKEKTQQDFFVICAQQNSIHGAHIEKPQTTICEETFVCSYLFREWSHSSEYLLLLNIYVWVIEEDFSDKEKDNFPNKQSLREECFFSKWNQC